MVYGASGYTGRLVAELGVERGHHPVLAGRDVEKVAALATPLGLPYRIFDLHESDAVDEALRGIDVVAHCAGPFSRTSDPMIEGCLRNGVHYLDITGEVDVFEATFTRDEQARNAGVVLLPGAGFDVVPTDCLAAMVAAELPTATHLDLAFRTGGGISAGTVKSAFEGAGGGGRARIDGELCSVPLGWRQREVPFPAQRRTATSLPWGDLSTAYRSTGIGNVTTYAAIPGMGVSSRVPTGRRSLLQYPVVQRLGRAAIGKLVRGPGPRRRMSSWSEVFAEAWDDTGNRVSAALIGPNAYDFTADSVLRIAQRLETSPPAPGTHTPSTAFGADLVRSMRAVKVIEPAV